MAAHIHRGGNQRHFQVHGLHVQHKRVEIVREPVHHIRYHHRLHAHGHGTFGEILTIRQRHDVPAADLMNPLFEPIGRSDGLHKTGLLVQPNRAHRNGVVVQLAFLAQELQGAFNALGRANQHGAIRIRALLTAEQHALTNDETFDNGDQQRAQQRQSSGHQRHIHVENGIQRANHQTREQRALDQERIELVTITHHMTVVHAYAVQAIYPNQRPNKHIRPQSNMEVETRGI